MISSPTVSQETPVSADSHSFKISQLAVNSDMLLICCSVEKNIPIQPVEGLSSVSIDRYSTECTSARHKTGNYNGLPVFVKFVETESLTLSRDDLLELELVRPFTFVFSIRLLRTEEY